MGTVFETFAHLEVRRVGQVLDNHVGGKNPDAATVEVEGDVLFGRGPAADVEERVEHDRESEWLPLWLVPATHINRSRGLTMEGCTALSLSDTTGETNTPSKVYVEFCAFFVCE